MLQRENYLTEELEARLKMSEFRKLTPKDTTELEEWTKELEGFDTEYWLHKLVWHKLKHGKPSGPLIREWDALNRREAILSRENELLCAANGGCCKRGCGCCEKPLNTHREEGIYGHCTVECGCCIRSRRYYGA